MLEFGLRADLIAAEKFVARQAVKHLSLANYKQRVETLRMFERPLARMSVAPFSTSLTSVMIPRLLFVKMHACVRHILSVSAACRSALVVCHILWVHVDVWVFRFSVSKAGPMASVPDWQSYDIVCRCLRLLTSQLASNVKRSRLGALSQVLSVSLLLSRFTLQCAMRPASVYNADAGHSGRETCWRCCVRRTLQTCSTLWARRSASKSFRR